MRGHPAAADPAAGQTGSRKRGRPARRGAWSAAAGRHAVLLLLAAPGSLLPAAPAAHAQSVVEVLQRQRLAARVAEVSRELGPRVEPWPLRELGTADPHLFVHDQRVARRRALADSLAQAARVARRADSLAHLPPPHLVWRKVEPAEQGGFVERFRETYWRATAGLRLPIDTVATPELRARMQTVFGRPTRNADAMRQVGYTGNEFVQFEYWFVVNDSIPALVLDLDGPFGRGLMFAGSEEFEPYMPRLKAELSARVVAAVGPDPFVDYYHSFERRQWFRTGYNGEAYFTLPIREPGWNRRERVNRWTIHR